MSERQKTLYLCHNRMAATFHIYIKDIANQLTMIFKKIQIEKHIVQRLDDK